MAEDVNVNWDDEESKQKLFDLLNSQAGESKYHIMSYVRDYANENYPDPQKRQSVVDKIDQIFTPKSGTEWMDLGVEGGLGLFEGASGNIADAFSDPSVKNAIKAVANNTMDVGFMADFFFANEAAKKFPPGPEQDSQVANQYTQIGVGILTTGLVGALAADGFFASIPVVAALASNPIGISILALGLGYAATQLMDHYWDDIVTGNAQGVLDTAEAIKNFFDGIKDGAGAVLDGIMNAPDFFDGLPDFIDGLMPAIKDFLPDLPSWIPDALNPFANTPGTDLSPRRFVGGFGDPLTFDLDGDGLELVALTNSTAHFDYFGDGFAEATGWVAPDDGLLVWDKNLDGNIAALELVGSGKPLSMTNDQGTTYTEDNGFTFLSGYDLNGDGKINAQDEIYSNLQIWRDLNQDGVSQSGELFTLAQLGIAAINLSGITTYAVDNPSQFWPSRSIADNPLTHAGTYTRANGTTGEIGDVWYRANYQDTILNGDYTLDVRTLFLPTVRGYGMLPDLHVAMSMDNGVGGLLEKVQTFATSRTGAQWFTQGAAVRTEAAEILMRWAKVNLANESIAEDGVFSKMKEFYFLKAWTGTDHEYNGTWYDNSHLLPRVADGIDAIHVTWNNVLDAYTARLMFQAGGAQYFDPGASYNPFTDTFEGTLRLAQSSMAELQAAAAANTDKMAFWRSFGVLVDGVMGFEALNATENGWLESAVSGSSGGSLHWSAVVDSFNVHTYYGTSGANTINGTAYDDIIYGGTQNWQNTVGDTLNGGAGDDRLIGMDGANGTADRLNGGLGNDIMEGGRGNDTYLYDSGHDVIVEPGGNFQFETDVIRFGAGINPGDVTLHYARPDTFMTNHYYLDVAGRGTITMGIVNNTTNFVNLIDKLYFANGTIVDVPSMDITFHGTPEMDNLTYYVFTGNVTIRGYAGDDTISNPTDTGKMIADGGAGNDLITLASRDDTVIFSAGDDTVRDGGGTDTILIPQGYTLADISFLRTEIEGALSGEYDDMKIVVAGLGSLTVDGFFGGRANPLEMLRLADGTQVNLLTQVFTAQGTDGDDFFQGTPVGWSQQNDVYLFGKGHDEVYENGGTDILRFGIGVNPGDITVARVNSSDLKFFDAQGNSMTFLHHFDELTNPTTVLERAEFANGIAWNLSVMEIQTLGTNNSDTIFAPDTGDASVADTIYSYDGNDQVNGGEGNDIIYAGAGDDRIYGDAGDDIIYGEAGNDYLFGDIGNDVIDGGTGENTLNGYAGADIYRLAALSRNIINDTEGLNSLILSLNRAELQTKITVNKLEIFNAGQSFYTSINDYNAFSDVTFSDGTKITMAQFLSGGSTPPSYNPTSGSDVINASAAPIGVTINLLAGNDTFIGSNFDDNVTAGDGNDTIEGGGGNDTLNGGNGIDTLTYANAPSTVTIKLTTLTAQNTGGAGSDTIANFENLTGSAFNDTLIGNANANIINGGNGNDTIEGGAGNDTLNGNGGIDTLSYASATAGITLNLATTTAQNTVGAGSDKVSGFENLIGSAFNDTLTGSGAANLIEGGVGNDNLNGASGQDTLAYASATAGVTVDLSLTTAQNTGGAGTDTISAFEHLTGSGYSDTLRGTIGANTIIGSSGNDTAYGNSGNDKLYGDDGVDTLYGDAGADILYGGAGNDMLYGGSGTDIFKFQSGGGIDTIQDFKTAQADKIDISDILDMHNPATDPLAGFVRITESGTNSFLFIDRDGGGNSFVQIAQLTGVTNFTSGTTATEAELQLLVTNGSLIV